MRVCLYIKISSKSGEVKYHWASENISDQAEQEPLDPRAETTFLNIIAALLDCITGPFKDQEFSSETKLREFIAEKYDGYPGLKARTLAEKFALAKREINKRY